MARANATRGEVTLKLEGVDYVLRPTYAAISAFEAETGKGLLRLTREAVNGDLTTEEAAVIATECIKAHGIAIGDDGMARFNARRVRELIAEAEGGFAAALGTIAGVLSGAVTGAYTSTGEVKAPAGKKATPAGA